MQITRSYVNQECYVMVSNFCSDRGDSVAELETEARFQQPTYGMSKCSSGSQGQESLDTGTSLYTISGLYSVYTHFKETKC